jgi:hypothetical protein
MLNYFSASTKYHYLGYTNVIQKGSLVWSLYEDNKLIKGDMPQGYNNASYYNLIHNGIDFRVNDAIGDLFSMMLTHNASGKLEKPSAAALRDEGFPTEDESTLDYQQTNGSKWIISAGGLKDKSYDFFKDRVFRNGYHQDDYEIRFTYNSENKAFTPFQDDVDRINVPFEIWNMTRNIRMIPAILDLDSNHQFALLKGEDHIASADNNDPYTDWIYFYLPEDWSKGDRGYQNWLNGDVNPERWRDYYVKNETLARIVFVNLDAGDPNDPNFPNNILAQMPEEGSIFKLIMNRHTEDLIIKINTKKTHSFILPTKPELLNNYPNPFNPVTSIPFKLNKAQNIEIRIFNALGQLIWSKKGFYREGPSIVKWDSKNKNGSLVASGIYFYQLVTNENTETKKMILLR